MEELKEFEVGVIPDEIEPRIGYKYLFVNGDGRMFSPQQHMEWPTLEKAVAEGCAFYDWEPHSRLPSKPYYLENEARSGAPAVPMVELPPGMSWYLVQSRCDAPGDGCSCGIYAVDRPSQCSQYCGGSRVLVEVAVWGKVVPASQGMRGQFAYPKAIYAERGNLELAQQVAALYRVPLIAAAKQEEDVLPLPVEPMRIELRMRRNVGRGFLAGIASAFAVTFAVVAVLAEAPMLAIDAAVFLVLAIFYFTLFVRS